MAANTLENVFSVQLVVNTRVVVGLPRAKKKKL